MKFCDDIKLMYMYYIMDVNDVLIFIERWNFGNYFIISMIECNFIIFCICMRYILSYMILSIFFKFCVCCVLFLFCEFDLGCIRLCYMIMLWIGFESFLVIIVGCC